MSPDCRKKFTIVLSALLLAFSSIIQLALALFHFNNLSPGDTFFQLEPTDLHLCFLKKSRKSYVEMSVGPCIRP